MKNVTINIARSIGQTYARNLTRFGGKRFAIHSMDSTNSTTKLITQHCDSQIHARNLKGPAGRDLICQARAEVLSAYSHKILNVCGQLSRGAEVHLLVSILDDKDQIIIHSPYNIDNLSQNP